MTRCQLRCVTAVIVAVSATALLASPERAGGQTTVANDQGRDSRPIPLATGSGVTALSEPRPPFFDITSYGAVSGGPAVANQKAINDAIAAAAAAGGGTVVVPAGDLRTCTIRLTSRVGLHFATRHSIVRAAVHGPAPQGDGGFYDAPEQNLFVGLQDHGHSHWANSLIFGVVATDRDGPTARIKLGTEGTTGFSRITIRNVTFDRSRGFALESVDGAELADIVLSDATMKHVSSSPIFIRLGDQHTKVRSPSAQT